MFVFVCISLGKAEGWRKGERRGVKVYINALEKTRYGFGGEN